MDACTGNKALRGGPAIIHITSEKFTKRDIKAVITSFDPRNQVAQDADGHGFTVADRNSFVEFAFPDGCDVSILDLTGVCNATVTFRLINGKAYAMSEAWFGSEDLGFSSDQGDISMRFSSQNQMEEVLAC
jgi:hypothetical protein